MQDKLYEIKEYLISKKYFIIGFIIIIFIGLFILLLFKEERVEEDFNIEDKEEREVVMTNKCSVDIKGYVANPNSYQIDCDLRVSDVIKIAGGLIENSDTSVLNLSKKISDGMVIVVYSKEEVANFVEVKKEETIKEEKCKNTSVVKNDACITKNERIDNDVTVPKKEDNISNNPSFNPNTNSNIKEEDNTPKIVNINTASKEELMTLKGIGESKAIAIIKYRDEHGLFNSIDDIKNIKGIGEKMFEKIKDFITL